MNQTNQTNPETKFPTVGNLPEASGPVAVLAPVPAPVAASLTKFTGYHQVILNGSKKIFLLRLLAGRELLSIKKALGRGEWGPFCKEKIIGPGVASNGALHNYMNYADEFMTKFPTVGNLVESNLLPNGEVKEEALAPIEKAIHEAADGKDITAFYRDLGIIRQPKKNEHHPRKETDPTATEEEKDKAANADWLAIVGDVELFLPVLERVTAENRDRILASFLKVTAQLRTIGKGRSSRAGKSGRAKLPLSPDQNAPKGKVILHRNPRPKKGASK